MSMARLGPSGSQHVPAATTEPLFRVPFGAPSDCDLTRKRRKTSSKAAAGPSHFLGSSQELQRFSTGITSDVPLPCNSDHNWTAQTEHHKNALNWVYLWSEVPTYSHAQIRKHCFSTTPAEAPWCHQHRHGLSKQSSNGTCFVQALHYKVVLESTLCNFVVQSSTGKYFLQALLYKVVLGNTFCKLCSTQ